MINTKQEQMFTEVAEAYANAGKKMDVWTITTFNNLRKNLNEYGNLSANQEKLLLSLTKYIPKSPSVDSKSANPKPAKSIKPTETQISQSLASQVPERFAHISRESKYLDMMNWVVQFESGLPTNIPTKEDIFTYGVYLKALGKHYSPPNSWKDEFDSYYIRFLIAGKVD